MIPLTYAIPGCIGGGLQMRLRCAIQIDVYFTRCCAVTDRDLFANLLQSLGFSASLMDSSAHKDSMYLEHQTVIVRSVNFVFLLIYLVQRLLQHLVSLITMAPNFPRPKVYFSLARFCFFRSIPPSASLYA